ncbi:MAG: thioredoxin family protein [Flavobacteriales bacterium]|nr:thioredoxin family protein [Flavobacteriales bacterium]
MLRIIDRILIIGILILIFSPANCQVVDPVKWKMEIREGENGQSSIAFISSIEEHWHVYSTILSDDPEAFGPIPTSIEFEPNDQVEIIGVLSPISNMLTAYDPNFEMDLNFFENEAIFLQNLKCSPGVSTELRGTFNYMACDDSKCIFPDPINFSVVVEDGMFISIQEVLPQLPGEAGGNKGIVNPIHWSVSSTDLGGGSYELAYTVQCDDHWHIYSQHLEGNEGPLPTVFGVVLPEGGEAGAVTEPEPHVEYDPNFKMDLAFFEGTATFTQKITLNEPTVLRVSVDYMACDDSGCLPPNFEEFDVDLATGEVRMVMAEASESFPGGNDESSPWEWDIDVKAPLSDCNEVQHEEESQSLWTIFFLGFGGGLLALITPCVFPMIPLTVSFFTKGSKDKRKGIQRAVIYGLFILMIYFGLSLPFHIWKIDPDVLNQFSTGVGLNVTFFVIFIVFAISFFGYFEITLPNKWANKADNASNAGGLLGIFFMALTLVIVSFSCTGPILGSILAGTITQGPMPLTAGMTGFGVALGLPFALFAMFPGWLNNLPKSGGWLNTTKVVLGFAEVALAFKFLSTADLVIQTGLLKRETFFLIWTIVALLTGIYLLGFIKFPHDSKKTKLSAPRVIIALAFIGFGIYLAPGVLKKPTWEHGLLAGFPPPHSYSWYEHDTDCPLGLDCAHDLDEALEMAREKGKPVFIDFTGWGCVNCRRMEENVWIKPEVFKLLDEEFQVVSLYVDDKRDLDEAEQFNVPIKYDDGSEKVKQIRTIGDKWSTLEILQFQNSTQPLYVIVTPDGKLMNSPVGYTPDEKEYADWLKCGLEAYQQTARK